MNPEHFRILRQGVDAWNRWRGENPEVGIDLFQAGLRGAELSGVNLSRVNLVRAGLVKADLRGADLSGALVLAQEQVDSANGDASTKLPDRIQRPAHWDSKSQNPL